MIGAEVAALRARAKSLRQAKEYAVALPLYRSLWERSVRSAWDGWGYAFCLNRLKRWLESLVVVEEVAAAEPGFAPIRSLIAWALFFTVIAVDPPAPEREFTAAAERICSLTTPADAFAPYAATVIRAAKRWTDPYDAGRILAWTERVVAADLSDRPGAFVSSDGKRRELASPREQWFSLRSEAFLVSRRYAKCVALCREALAGFTRFHYGNEVWFRRRLALALAGLEKADEARTLLEDCLARKREWFILKELAELRRRDGDTDGALRLAAEAALARGDLDKKVGLFQLLAELLAGAGNTEAELRHLVLVWRIRTAQGWRLDPGLLERLTAAGVLPKQPGDWCATAAGLTPLWRGLAGTPAAVPPASQSAARQTGTIATVFPHGGAGFLAGKNGRSWFFSAREYRGDRVSLAPGVVVSFELGVGFDRKKGTATQVAVDIRPTEKTP